jgi:succinate dehydrogenase hydrophobic anchor subunit
MRRDTMRQSSGGTMNERHHRLHRFRLLFASSLLVVFFACGTLAIIAWLPIFPEAVAVTNEPDNAWTQYMTWHQSWRYDAGPQALSCSE